MVQDVELDEEKFSFQPKDDVFSISNVLKQCRYLSCLIDLALDKQIDLRELPEPVFPLPQSERVKYSENRGKRSYTISLLRLDMVQRPLSKATSAPSEVAYGDSLRSIRRLSARSSNIWAGYKAIKRKTRWMPRILLFYLVSHLFLGVITNGFRFGHLRTGTATV